MHDPTPDEVYQAAMHYAAGGFSVIPIGSDKFPVLEKWGPYQDSIATPEEIKEWYGNGNRYGIAIIQGKVSGGIQTIDIEARAAHLFSAILEEFEQHCPGVPEKLVTIGSASGGYHLPYRCEQIGGSRKLAWRIVRDDKGEPILGEKGKQKTELLIEIKGEGGYVVTYPSPALCHPDRKHYKPIAGNWFELSTLTPEQSETLIAICASYNEYVEPIYEPTPKAHTNGNRPGDDFNARATWAEVLEPHGWRQVKQRGAVTLWRKPNAHKSPYHATTNFGGSDLFYAFSTNCAFESEKGYSKFAAYTLLNYAHLSEDNFKAAAKELGKQGYGANTYTPDVYTTQSSEPENKDAKVYELNHAGNVARLVDLHGANTRYSYTWKTWLDYRAGRWVIDEGERIARKVKDVVRSMCAEAARCENDAHRADLIRWAGKCDDPNFTDKMLRKAQSEEAVTIPSVDDLDSDLFLFNCQNGTIDLRTGELRPHQREDLITKISPIAYDPEAKATLFESWLLEMMNNDGSLVDFLQRAVGYSLTGDVREHVLLILYGTGSNGKSTLLSVILDLMADYAATTPIETLMVQRFDQIPTDLARLQGIRFVSAAETEEGRRLAESKIKRITGGDKIPARHLYSKGFEYYPQFKLWISANHRPVIRGTDMGMWRRIRLIPFCVTIPDEKQDKTLLSKLRAELPGILAWAVRGCLNWLDSGLPLTEAVKTATRNYQRDMDTLADFLEACCIQGPGMHVQSRPLYQAFKHWAESSGEAEMSEKSFSLKLSERGYKKKSTKNGAVWVDLGLKEGDG